MNRKDKAFVESSPQAALVSPRLGVRTLRAVTSLRMPFTKGAGPSRLVPAPSIREHYEIEKALSARLRNTTWEARQSLYRLVYDEFHGLFPDNPMAQSRKRTLLHRRRTVKQMALLRPFLKRTTVFLEIGAGSCALACEIANRVKHVYAIEVSQTMTGDLAKPPNFTFLHSDGRSVPVVPASVDVLYSDNVMEHLHPDDALVQLLDVYAALSHGGVYICVTPNRITGPHDISKHFDAVATGFHLKEYTTLELTRLFKQAGFSRIQVLMGGAGRFVRVPPHLVCVLETFLARLPFCVRKRFITNRVGSALLGVRIVGTK